MLDAKSMARLDGVHADLVAVILHAAEHGGVPFRVTEGVRTLEKQRAYVKSGASKTMRSRHLTGHAVDLCLPGHTNAECFDDAGMRRLSEVVKASAAACGVPVEWGGDWTSFCDTPHYQLPWAQYPAEKASQPHAGPTIEAKATEVRAEPVAEPVPPPSQAPAPAPAPASPVAQAMTNSKTILGALLAFAGGLVQYVHETFAAICEGLSAAASYAPVQSLLTGAGINARAVGFGLGAFGVVLVVTRRLDAARKGKIG